MAIWPARNPGPNGEMETCPNGDSTISIEVGGKGQQLFGLVPHITFDVMSSTELRYRSLAKSWRGFLKTELKYISVKQRRVQRVHGF
jgi:hypothetical protein